MNLNDVFRLVGLAAIWGFSFIFMKVLSPVLGAVTTAELRALIAGSVLTLYFVCIGYDPHWRRFYKQYLVIGLLNSAIPFLLFSYATTHLPASYVVILNATPPFFGVLFSFLFFGQRLSKRTSLGLCLGLTGVGLVAQVGPAELDSQSTWAVLACLVATSSYALAALYMKQSTANAGLDPIGVAGASQLCAGLILLPLVPFAPPMGELSTWIVLNILGLSLFCTAFAFHQYYKLIGNIGSIKALTVTLLIPIFGIVWGAVLLDEEITISMIAGCTFVLLGVGFVLGLFPTLYRTRS